MDDHLDAVESMLEVLVVDGYEATVAFDGAAGLNWARRFVPDVIPWVIGLPKMDGYAVARAFRADAELRGIAFIALIGHASAEFRKRRLAPRSSGPVRLFIGFRWQ